MPPSFKQRRGIHDRFAGLGVGGSDQTADHGDSARLGGNAFRRLTIAGHKRGSLHQIARRIAADGKFRKQNQAGAGGTRPAREVDDLGSVAGEVSNCGIDLSQRDLHASSVKRERAGAKSGEIWTADFRLQVSDLTTYLTQDFQSEICNLKSEITSAYRPAPLRPNAARPVDRQRPACSPACHSGRYKRRQGEHHSNRCSH